MEVPESLLHPINGGTLRQHPGRELQIAYRFGWINTEELLESAKMYGKSPYGQHLTRVAEDRVKHLK